MMEPVPIPLPSQEASGAAPALSTRILPGIWVVQDVGPWVGLALWAHGWVGLGSGELQAGHGVTLLGRRDKESWAMGRWVRLGGLLRHLGGLAPVKKMQQ